MAESESEKTSKKDIRMTMSAEQVRTLVQELLQALPNRNPPVQPREVDEGSFAKDIQNFKRKLPAFIVGQQPYNQFRMEFDLNVEQSGFVLPVQAEVGRDAYVQARDKRNNALRGLLYQCLSTEARRLAGRRLYPTSEECQFLTIDEYSTKLQALFEPASESETARHEFQARVQLKLENPIMYLSDKVALFERAYSAEQRDLQVLFDSTTNGLYNDSLRKDMRRTPVQTEEEYERKLSFYLNAIRKAVIAGDLSESDAVGTQTFSATCSYLLQRNENMTSSIKNEPGIQAMQKRSDKGRYVVRCYYCHKVGHIAKDCSRKLAGLPPVKSNSGRVVAVIDENSDSERDSQQEYEEGEICVLRRKKRMSNKRNRSADKSKSIKSAIQELVNENDESLLENSGENTDQTPPAATAEVNTLAAAEEEEHPLDQLVEEFDQLDESYFLGL